MLFSAIIYLNVSQMKKALNQRKEKKIIENKKQEMEKNKDYADISPITLNIFEIHKIICNFIISYV